MRILVVHNYYSRRCGEDAAFEDHVKLLTELGCTVRTFLRSNRPLLNGISNHARAFVSGLGNPISSNELLQEAKAFYPDVIHYHNVVPMVSTMAMRKLARAGFQQCMTLHNFRLTCPENHHVRNGELCFLCIGSSGWDCVRHRCLGSRLESFAHAAWWWSGHFIHHYADHIDGFIALSQFQRDFMSKAGLCRERIHVIPNMVTEPVVPGDEFEDTGSYVAFVGRPSPEKGLEVLTRVASRLPHVKFKVTGTKQQWADYSPPQNIEVIGWLDPCALANFYAGSRFCVLPSQWFEGHPITIIESASHRRTVVCSRIGGLPEFVVDGQTGLLVDPQDVEGWVHAIAELWGNPGRAAELGRRAEAFTRETFSVARHAQSLTELYRQLSN